MTKRMIVKVQVPLTVGHLASGKSEAEIGSLALVYNKNRYYMFYPAVNEEIKKLMGDRPKKFFLADVGKEGFEIVKEVEWQSW